MRRLCLPSLFIALILAGCGRPAQVTLYEDRQGGLQNSSGDATTRTSGIHTVRQADSVYRIAQRYGMSTRALIEANGLRPPYRLLVGQQLKLPRPRLHTVARGETVYGISRQYGLAMNSLAQMNGLQAPYKIVVGQTLRLPGAVEVAPNVSSAQPGKSVAEGRRQRRDVRTEQARPASAVARGGPRQRVPPLSAGGFIWPLEGKVISRFGVKGKGLHNDGINLAAPRGTPVRAAQTGVVAYAGNELRGFGNLVLIRHSNGIMTAYAHNEELLVKQGQKVERGQKVAKVGSSGSVETPQLHFEVRSGRDPIDPVKFLRRNAAT